MARLKKDIPAYKIAQECFLPDEIKHDNTIIPAMSKTQKKNVLLRVLVENVEIPSIKDKNILQEVTVIGSDIPEIPWFIPIKFLEFVEVEIICWNEI